MKIVKKLLMVFSIILIFEVNCSKLQDSKNPNLISDKEARVRITLAIIAKCSETGGSFSNISTSESLVTVLFSGSSNISSADKSGLYYKKSNVTNCVSAILVYDSPDTCNFNNFASLNYVANKKLCNLEPDRSIKLNIVSNK